VFGDPSAPVRILAELQAALAERGFGSVTEAVGLAHLPAAEQVRRRGLSTGELA